MSPIEKLLEAIQYAEDEDTIWVEYFDSEDKAISVLQDALEEDIEDVDEYELASLADLLNVDMYELVKPVVYLECLNILKADLHEYDTD